MAPIPQPLSSASKETGEHLTEASTSDDEVEVEMDRGMPITVIRILLIDCRNPFDGCAKMGVIWWE